jgi:hypothetical protein
MVLAINASAQRWDYNWDIKAHDKGQFKFQIGTGIQRTENQFWFYKAANLLDRPDWPSSANDNNFEVYLSQANFRLRTTGPIVTRFEYGLNRAFSISLGAAVTQYTCSWTKQIADVNTGTNQPVDYGVGVTNIGVVMRANYHVKVNTHWDLYLAGGPGYDITKVTDFTDNVKDTTYTSSFKSSPPVWFDYGFGARYYFLRRSAIFAEVGYGKSYANVGIILKALQPKKNRTY